MAKKNRTSLVTMIAESKVFMISDWMEVTLVIGCEKMTVEDRRPGGYRTVSPDARCHSRFIHRDASPERRTAAGSSVHQVSLDTATLGTCDFKLPQSEPDKDKRCRERPR